MRLLYFNPENDLALAANDPHYTPPASALQMATDLQRLPLRWAEPDDFVLLRDGSFIDAQGKTLHPALSALNYIPLPWGWSPLVVSDFLRAGIPASLLPSPSEMQAFRTLAGRATSAVVLRHLQEHLQAAGYGDCVIGEAHVCHDLHEARCWHEQWRDSIFKQPWSGSGRGILPVHEGVLTAKNEAWIRRTLRQQGYVMAEPLYNRYYDFALEFWRHADGHVTYEGLSLFMTTAGGVYAGNIVDTEEGKRRRLSSLIDLALLDFVTSQLMEELSSLPPTFYVGPLGVDLLITTEGLLHPCIEINFRMTMGWLALHIPPFFEEKSQFC